MNLKKGDQVKILSGKDRGKQGSLLKVWKNLNRVTVEGINTFKKRIRPTRQGEKGDTVVLPRPINASKVQLICKNCKKPTRVGFRMNGDKKERYCKKCEATF
jgi:large subunit ribosomal protein L24